MNSILEIRNLSKRFGGLVAVSDLSFHVEHGSINGLIGPNGAGKTTLFNLVAGQIPPTSGSVMFKGTDVGRLAPYQRVRLGMARSFQSTVLYSEATVLENMLRGLAASRRPGFTACLPYTAAARAFESGLERRAAELLDLLDLNAARDELARNLPYGHQRALGIGIALASDPSLLMLDEPVAGMNSTETSLMAEIVRRINATGTSILLVEHDMSFVMGLCRHIVVINQGRKLMEGDPASVRQHPDVIAAYLGEAEDD